MQRRTPRTSEGFRRAPVGSRSATSRCVYCRDNVAAVGLEPGEPHVAGEGVPRFVLARTYGTRKIASLLGAESFPKGTPFGTHVFAYLKCSSIEADPRRANLDSIARTREADTRGPVQ